MLTLLHLSLSAKISRMRARTARIMPMTRMANGTATFPAVTFWLSVVLVIICCIRKTHTLHFTEGIEVYDDTVALGKTLVVLSDSHITPSRYFFIVNLTLFKTKTKKIVLKIVRITIYQSFRHNQKRKTTLERSDKPPLRP